MAIIGGVPAVLTVPAASAVRDDAGAGASEVLRRVQIAPRPTLEHLHEAVSQMAEVQARIHALGGELLVAVERARRIAERLEDEILATESPRLRELDPGRAADLARRALVEETRNALGVGPRTAAALLADAELLTRDAPATLAAVLDGVLSERCARVLAEEVAGLLPGEVAAVERAVLPRVRDGGGSVPRFRALVRRARETVHPVPAEVRHTDAAARRGVWVDPAPDGMATLTALLTAQAAHAMFDRLTRTGQLAAVSGDPRTLAQLRADTLADLVLDDGTLDRLAAMLPAVEPDGPPDGLHPVDVHPARVRPADVRSERRSGEPRSTSHAAVDSDDAHLGAGETDSPAFLARFARSVRPRVQVTVPVTTLLGGAAPGTLDGHTPIDPDTARVLAAHAPSFRRILTHPESGAVLSVGRDSYTVPADLREWLRVRDVTCRFPGCGRVAARCDVDHTTDWAAGGATDADNLAHLCRAHHTLKHRTRWRVDRARNGTLTWTSPAGHTYTTVPGNAVTRSLLPAGPAGPPGATAAHPAAAGPTPASPTAAGPAAASTSVDKVSASLDPPF